MLGLICLGFDWLSKLGLDIWNVLVASVFSVAVGLIDRLLLSQTEDTLGLINDARRPACDLSVAGVEHDKDVG